MGELLYLRERGDDVHTSLREYLDIIYPANDFVYDEQLDKALVLDRNASASYRRFRPDARSESLDLIVEFDGVDHYKENRVVVGDRDRDNWFASLGYSVVRIPYWIQLTHDVVHAKFNVDADSELCTLTRSFYDTADHGLSTAPGSMCYLGQLRFISDVTRLPASVQMQVCDDILACIDALDDLPAGAIMPVDIIDAWLDADHAIDTHELVERCRNDAERAHTIRGLL